MLQKTAKGMFYDQELTKSEHNGSKRFLKDIVFVFHEDTVEIKSHTIYKVQIVLAWYVFWA